MSKQPTIADYIVRRVAREGITDCSGVAGDFAFNSGTGKYHVEWGFPSYANAGGVLY